MEDNLPVEETFAPSIFDTAKEMSFDSKTPNTPTVEEEEDKLIIDLDTAKILVEIPFDIASQICKLNDICLTEKQSDKLGKLWKGPLKRILAKYEDSDIIVAAAATLSIAGEKYLEYKLELSRRNSTGDAGEGKDKLHKEQTP